MRLPNLTARNVAIGRVIAGSVYLALPELLVRPWAGTADPGIKALGRAIGARDLALGLGALLAIQRNGSAQPWFTAAAFIDAADAIATVVAFRQLPPLGRWVILGAAITGAAASTQVVRVMQTAPHPAITAAGRNKG